MQVAGPAFVGAAGVLSACAVDSGYGGYGYDGYNNSGYSTGYGPGYYGNGGVVYDSRPVYPGYDDRRAWAERERLDRERDRLQWRRLTAPLLLGRSVVVGDESGLVHLLSREDAAPLNRLATDGSPIAATPVVAADTLVVVTRKGGVYGFRPE